jgi:hypothetical protein
MRCWLETNAGAASIAARIWGNPLSPQQTFLPYGRGGRRRPRRKAYRIVGERVRPGSTRWVSSYRGHSRGSQSVAFRSS